MLQPLHVCGIIDITLIKPFYCVSAASILRHKAGQDDHISVPVFSRWRTWRQWEKKTKIIKLSPSLNHSCCNISVYCSNKAVWSENIMMEILTDNDRQINLRVWTLLLSWFDLSADVTTKIFTGDVLYNQGTVRWNTQSVGFRCGLFTNLPESNQPYCCESRLTVDPGGAATVIEVIDHVFTRQSDFISNSDSELGGMLSRCLWWEDKREMNELKLVTLLFLFHQPTLFPSQLVS